MIYHAATMDEIESDPIDCTGFNTTSFEVASNEHVAIIIQGETADSSIELQYQYQTRYSWLTQENAYIVGGFVLCIFTCTVCFIQAFVLSKEAEVSISRAETNLRDSGFQMTICSEKMHLAFQEYQRNPYPYQASKVVRRPNETGSSFYSESNYNAPQQRRVMP
jgi:hypothetical protein